MKPQNFDGNPEIAVDVNQSMMEPISSRVDPPEPTVSLSPKSSRSNNVKDAKKHVRRSRKRREDGQRSPTSPESSSHRNTRSPPRSPRTSDIHSDFSREPPEKGVATFSDDRDERFFFPNIKGAEPPDGNSEDVLSPIPYVSQREDALVTDGSKQAMDDIVAKHLAAPHEFKKSKSTKSAKSAKSNARSTRSASRRRNNKVQQILELPDSTHSLHGVFSGHLMKWRFEAEEGGPFVRIPAFFGNTGLIITTTYALIFDPNTWTILSIILALFIYAIALLGLVLEGRFMCSNPLGIRAHLRSALTRRNRVFRFVWGRGLLYIVAGLLSCVLILIPSVVVGVFMVCVGATAVVAGGYASRMFYLLRDSLKDDDYLASAFKRYDADNDGFITLPEFVNLLSFLGMDLDDRIGIKAFHAADANHEYKISQEAFQTWWKAAFLKNGKSPTKLDDMASELGTDEEEGSYQRMGE